jgi:hypothetical protein
MKIQVNILTKSIEIELGEGRQSIKWLAQVVSARIVSQRLLRSTFEEEKQLVVGMLDKDGSMVDPNACIADVIEDGGCLRANVLDEVLSDKFGNPVVPVWRQEAFIHSGPGIVFARGHEAWKRNPSRMRTAGTAGEAGQDSLVFVGELTDADIFSALELDWSMIDWSWAVPNPTEEFLFRLKDAVKGYYGIVCRLFSFCAGAGRAGERYGLTLADFRHIMHCSGLFAFSALKKIEAAYVAAAGEIPADNAPSRPVTAATAEGVKWALMSRSEYMEALCRVAVGHFPEQDSKNKPSVKELEDHVLQSVVAILSGPMATYWSIVSEKMESCSNQYTRDLLQHSEGYLKEIFEKYGSVSREGPVVVEGTLRDIIYGAGVAEERLAYNQILEDIFLRRCRVVLPAVDGYGHDNSSTDGHSTPGRSGFGSRRREQSATPSGADDIHELTFSEFREAIVIAVKYAYQKSDELNEDEKMQAGIERLIQIVTRPHK